MRAYLAALAALVVVGFSGTVMAQTVNPNGMTDIANDGPGSCKGIETWNSDTKKCVEKTPYGALATPPAQPPKVDIQPPALPLPPAMASTSPTKEADCPRVSVSVPVIPGDKPATFFLDIKDKEEGLVADLKTCNPKLAVDGFVRNSTRSAKIRVTQGLDGNAFLRLPPNRKARLIISVMFTDESWKEARWWTSDGPLAARDDVTLVKGDDKIAGPHWQ